MYLRVIFAVRFPTERTKNIHTVLQNRLASPPRLRNLQKLPRKFLRHQHVHICTYVQYIAGVVQDTGVEAQELRG
jgi:hypothetical protein